MGAEENIWFKEGRVKSVVAKNTQREPPGSVKRNKYNSSDEIEQRLAQQIARVRQFRGLYTHILYVERPD